MSVSCPSFGLAQFERLKRCGSKGDVQEHFTPLLDRLHKYLNALPCFEDLQRIRKRWMPGVSETRPAFFKEKGLPVGLKPLHWYSYHRGGRSEAQFNVGMYPTHLRLGLGFNFTGAGFGTKKELVEDTYAAFRNMIAVEETSFRSLANANAFQIERRVSRDEELEFVPTEGTVDWLLAPLEKHDWVFVGRLLCIDNEADRALLKCGSDLGTMIEKVFADLKPIWIQTQMSVA